MKSSAIFLVSICCLHLAFSEINDTTVPPADPTTLPAVASPTLPASPNTTAAPLNTTAAPFTTADPLACSSDSSTGCLLDFKKLYARNATNETTADDRDLMASLRCGNVSAEVDDTCLIEIQTTNCSTLTVKTNHTRFGVRCSGLTGRLKFIAWSPEHCPEHVQRTINETTSAFCWSSINNTLVCKTTSVNNSGVFVNAFRDNLVAPLMKSRGCVVTPTTPIPLLPNPVGPAAITAIVVLVCLFITAILAGFFFWPKCHIKEAALLPKKTKPEKSTGVANQGFDMGSSGVPGSPYSGQAKYDVKGQAVAVGPRNA